MAEKKGVYLEGQFKFGSPEEEELIIKQLKVFDKHSVIPLEFFITVQVHPLGVFGGAVRVTAVAVIPLASEKLDISFRPKIDEGIPAIDKKTLERVLDAKVVLSDVLYDKTWHIYGEVPAGSSGDKRRIIVVFIPGVVYAYAIV